jgi:HTH-type transcriptional regulator / antitoxin HigA
MTTTLDRQVYASLLGQVQPKVIESEEENELFLAEVDKLMAFGEDLTPEQIQLMNLLVSV